MITPRLLLCSMLLSVALLSAEAPHHPSGTAFSNPFGFVFDGTIIDGHRVLQAPRGGNGRSCATCHRPEDSFGLTPATVEARYQSLAERAAGSDPAADDPLFRSIDADDFERTSRRCEPRHSSGSCCRCRPT